MREAKAKIGASVNFYSNTDEFTSAIGEFVNEGTIKEFWRENDFREYVVAHLDDIEPDKALSIVTWLAKIIAEKNEKDVSKDDASLRAEVVLSLLDVASKSRNYIRSEKINLSGMEDDIYWALAMANPESRIYDTDPDYPPRAIGYVREGIIAPPSTEFIEKLVEDKNRVYTADRMCFFLTLAFGTDPSEPEKLGEVLLDNPNILLFYGIANIVSDGIVTRDELEDKSNSRLLQRMTHMSDDAVKSAVSSFVKFYSEEWEPNVLARLFPDIEVVES